MKTTCLLLLFILPSCFAFTQEITGFSPKNAEKQRKWEQRFLELPRSEDFRNHLKELTKTPHVAGSEGGRRVVNYLTSSMEAAGLAVKQYDYDVYLVPKPIENRVEIISPERIPLNNQEYIIPGDIFSSNKNATWGWNAYSGTGDVTAEVVYANRATKQDFEQLKKWGVSVEGKIVIARYGGNFRGYKAKYAELNGAAGLVIFSDPQDNGYMRGLEYPEGAFGGASCIQRGSLLTLDYTGDPLTPFEPALPMDTGKQVERLDPSEVAFHTIPVTPIPYGSAREILKRMKGAAVPKTSWQGGLPFTYRMEGGEELKVRLKVDQKKQFVRATNVVGTITGSHYPDEWIILGCHHDAWAYGAIDPNSGTAMLLTMVDALGKLMKEGFRPKRSILFAHWDAEEHGIIASTEWVEQFREELSAKAVAYINADGSVSGGNFGAASSPSLKRLIEDATKEVLYPNSDSSVFDHWVSRSPNKQTPPIGNLGGGSDHVAFYTHVGVPSLMAGMGGANGVYHSIYDNFNWYSQFADKDFVYGPTLSKVDGIITLRLANADLIPYGVGRYAKDLEIHLKNAEKKIQAYAPEASFSDLLNKVGQLQVTSERFQKVYTDRVRRGIKGKKQVAINQQLIALEKSFIDTKGMAYGPWYRSLYASPDPYSGYASWILPGFLYEASLNSTTNLANLKNQFGKAIDSLSAKISSLTEQL